MHTKICLLNIHKNFPVPFDISPTVGNRDSFLVFSLVKYLLLYPKEILHYILAIFDQTSSEPFAKVFVFQSNV